MKQPKTKQENWEKEFDKLIGEKHYIICEGKKCVCYKSIKSFISQLLNQQAKDIIGEIEKEIKEIICEREDLTESGKVILGKILNQREIGIFLSGKREIKNTFKRFITTLKQKYE